MPSPQGETTTTGFFEEREKTNGKEEGGGKRGKTKMSSLKERERARSIRFSEEEYAGNGKQERQKCGAIVTWRGRAIGACLAHEPDISPDAMPRLGRGSKGRCCFVQSSSSRGRKRPYIYAKQRTEREGLIYGSARELQGETRNCFPCTVSTTI